MLARLRPLYNQLVLPLGRISAKLGFTANGWTMISFLISLVAAFFLSRGNFWLGLALVVLMYIADGLDGATARATGTASKFGTVLDHVVDRYAEFAIITGLLLGQWISPASAMFCASGVIMASYVRAKAESCGGVKDCTVGIAGRAEKLILIYGTIIMLGLKRNDIAEILIWLTGLISHITAFQRLMYTRRQIKPIELGQD